MSEVTVVIPAMNREFLLSRALDSVGLQTVAPFETLVVDDASTDLTGLVARERGARVLTMPSRSGPGQARNAGIAAATTEWVAFLDSDDEWEPDHLELLLNASRNQVLVCAPAHTTSGRTIGNVTGRQLVLTPRRLLVPGDAIVTSGTMVRRAVLNKVGGFGKLDHAEDLDLWLRVLECGPGVATGARTVLYREHSTQTSSDGASMREAFESIIARYSDRPWLTRRVRIASYGRVIWDDLRKGQRSRDWALAWRSARWLATHPFAWSAVLQLLRQRRLGRRPCPDRMPAPTARSTPH